MGSLLRNGDGFATIARGKKDRGMIEFYGGYQVYSDSGVDLTMLRENLKRTATERLLKNSRGIRLLRALDQAREEGHGSMANRKRIPPELEIEAIVHQLAATQVQYILVGGLAMRLQGSAHITDDCDICYARTPQNIEAVASAFSSLHAYLRGAPLGLPFRFDAATIQAGLNFTLTTDLGDLDVLGEISGIGGYEQVLAQSQEKNLFGISVRVLTIHGLIAAKRAAGRAKDRDHLLELEELKKLRDNG
jgi:hypothetical protein